MFFFFAQINNNENDFAKFQKKTILVFDANPRSGLHDRPVVVSVQFSIQYATYKLGPPAIIILLSTVVNVVILIIGAQTIINDGHD